MAILIFFQELSGFFVYQTLIGHKMQMSTPLIPVIFFAQLKPTHFASTYLLHFANDHIGVVSLHYIPPFFLLGTSKFVSLLLK